MRPAGPFTSSSTRLARPFQTLVTIVVPSYSTQSCEPDSGRRRRFTCVFHVPNSQSKSCGPCVATVSPLDLGTADSDGGVLRSAHVTSARQVAKTAEVCRIVKAVDDGSREDAAHAVMTQ